MTTYEVGQEVIIRDVNQDRRWYPDGEPPTGVITKVGRTLAHVRTAGLIETYRLEDGTRNDHWGTGRIQTMEEFQEDRARDRALARLRERRVSILGGGFTADQLTRMADIADE